jgi:membrane protein YqaA with SNARE-associated domain
VSEAAASGGEAASLPNGAVPSPGQAARPRSPARLTALRILALLAVVGITVFIFSIREQAEQLEGYGYPGIFLLSLLSNATLVLPAPGIAITFAMGAVFNPIFVGLAAGSGAALGELTGYLAGFSGRAVVERSNVYLRLEQLTSRYGPWTILALAALPNPVFDLAGVAAGALRMPVTTFLLWAWLGKLIKMVAAAYLGAFSMDWALRLLG